MRVRPASLNASATPKHSLQEISERLCALVKTSRNEYISETNIQKLNLDPIKTQWLTKLICQLPIVEEHEGVLVVRDDLLPGGTKSRLFVRLFAEHDEIVYASTTWGGAQVALAHCAKLMNKKATIFVAKRGQLHPRTLEALSIGGRHTNVIQIPHGFLNVLQFNAKRYCEQNKEAYYLEVGGKSSFATEVIAKAAKQVEDQNGPFDEVWSVAGSGTLAQGLQAGVTSKKTKFFVVQVGMDIKEPGKAKVFSYPKKLEQELRIEAPFPSCPNFDRKAWQTCTEQHGNGKILFWNVLGPSIRR